MENICVNSNLSLAEMNWDNVPEVKPTKKELKMLKEADKTDFCEENEISEIFAKYRNYQ